MMDEAETSTMDPRGGTIMSTARPPALAPLIEGQRLRQPEFHERYEAMPPRSWFELIGGVVVMSSPVGMPHGNHSANAVGWLSLYRFRTPGVQVLDNASTALDELSEVQPDALMRILPERGGQSHNLGNIVGGAPELVVEVAHSSRAIDLGAKLVEYGRTGTLEYVVFTIDPDDVHWHVRQGDRLVRVPPDPDGLYRSRVFPGLWLDPAAFFADDGFAIVATLQRGLATEEHANFVARLARP
jgi:Uma2 family endonuclease